MNSTTPKGNKKQKAHVSFQASTSEQTQLTRVALREVTNKVPEDAMDTKNRQIAYLQQQIAELKRRTSETNNNIIQKNVRLSRQLTIVASERDSLKETVDELKLENALYKGRNEELQRIIQTLLVNLRSRDNLNETFQTSSIAQPHLELNREPTPPKDNEFTEEPRRRSLRLNSTESLTHSSFESLERTEQELPGDSEVDQDDRVNTDEPMNELTAHRPRRNCTAVKKRYIEPNSRSKLRRGDANTFGINDVTKLYKCFDKVIHKKRKNSLK